jgi:hypothetical protein
MKEKIVTIYESRDGLEWRSSQEAINHENYLNFCEWYSAFEDNKLFSMNGDFVNAAHAYNWLMENRSLLKKWVLK